MYYEGMLSNEKKTQIISLVTEYWNDQLFPLLGETLSGKEIGHKIADIIDEKTTSLLHAQMEAGFERDGKGSPRSRSMGDIWIKDGGIYHPMNVKAGITGSEGQPNMVSMHKLLNNLIKGVIDSYYILYVKVSLEGEKPQAKITLVDLLDIIPYLAFDAGPGQIMLKSKRFFELYNESSIDLANTSVSQKTKLLFELMIDGEERLIKNRAKRLEAIRIHMNAYKDASLEEIEKTQLSHLKVQ